MPVTITAERLQLPTRSAALARSAAPYNKDLPPTPKVLPTPRLPPAPKLPATHRFPSTPKISPAPTRLPASGTTRALARIPEIRRPPRSPDVYNPEIHSASGTSYTSRGSARPTAMRRKLRPPQHTRSPSITQPQLPHSPKKYTLVDASVPKNRPKPLEINPGLSPSTEDTVASLQATNARAAALLGSRSDSRLPTPTQHSKTTSSKAVSASDHPSVTAPQATLSDRDDRNTTEKTTAERHTRPVSGPELRLDIGDAPQPRHTYQDRPYHPPRRAKAIIRKGKNRPRARAISHPQTPVLSNEEVESPMESPTSRFNAMSHYPPSTHLLLESTPVPPPYIPTSGSTRRVQGPRSMRKSPSTSTSSSTSSFRHSISGYTSPSVHTASGPAHLTGQSIVTPSIHPRSLHPSTSFVSSDSPAPEDSVSRGHTDEVWKRLSSFAPASQVGKDEESLLLTPIPRPSLLRLESWASPMWKPSPTDSPRTNMKKLIMFASSNHQALILSIYEKPLTPYKRKDATLHSLDTDVRETYDTLRSVPSPAIFNSLGFDDSEDEDEDYLLESPVVGTEKVAGESTSDWVARLIASHRD
ncbi:hypothetical protein BOTBODRAFT_168683 [Botryobasidium botryosum FD-172 SS1]|uniref:Uncharacterized protein n=1 Tax=Botryobasidium botryosum (strain FD-172 SS1) TaxID=930990 RepID=A0A067NCC0_BOTB1|nr:hypothetical protein BOTBODRAFT_168683 [Botryobasidium botryosum FD-172 SS1]